MWLRGGGEKGRKGWCDKGEERRKERKMDEMKGGGEKEDRKGGWDEGEEERRKIGKVDVMKVRGGEEKEYRKGGCDEGAVRKKKERWML
jgi:hypothetical protein